MTSESEVQQQIRLEAARRGTPLLRNNSGACRDDTGRMIRYGLGNDSARLNKEFKSSDLIGIWPRLITQEMVGQTIGQFFAVEVKPPGWKQRPGDARAAAQLNFGRWAADHGGIFTFATGIDEVWSR